ncbi:MAG: ADP-ribosylglycohydrolase family protein [Victivallales bacterium]|nr:ADP-ribosylglycohydrolase family protein [Victivallales bacterium]
MNIINSAEYRDKVRGCWTGKNIGGTLGAPFEGQREMRDISFYVQDLKGNPVPNDDLDLQLIWLFAAEKHGVYNLTENLLAEYWMQNIIAPWNEYAVCRANIRNGLYPPLSGSCNNDTWKNSNGAWIRAEIWACLFPGEPDRAAQFAYMDACVDHCGDGIYAEMFIAALEAAAFIVDDLRRLIDIGLSKIPPDSRIARSVKLACKLYDNKNNFADARNAIVRDSEDLGWFQAPANIGFTVLGLLYGEGDFGKSVCYAVNCGDDTDCTGATAGSIFGIMRGISGIPGEWVKPIGDKIITVAVDPVDARRQLPLDLSELTERVIRLAASVQYENPALLRIGDETTRVSDEHIAALASPEFAKSQLWTKSPYKLTFSLPFGMLAIDYENGPEVVPGEAKNVKLSFVSSIVSNKSVNLKWRLPEGWRVLPSPEVCINSIRYREGTIEQTIIPGDFEDAYFYLPLEVKLVDRNNRLLVNIPVSKSGVTVCYPQTTSPLCSIFARHQARIQLAKKG